MKMKDFRFAAGDWPIVVSSEWKRIFGDRNPATLQEIELQVQEENLRIHEQELIKEMARVAFEGDSK